MGTARHDMEEVGQLAIRNRLGQSLTGLFLAELDK